MSLHFGQRYLYVFFWLADAVLAAKIPPKEPANETAVKNTRRRIGLLIEGSKIDRAKSEPTDSLHPLP